MLFIYLFIYFPERESEGCWAPNGWFPWLPDDPTLEFLVSAKFLFPLSQSANCVIDEQQ